MFEGRENWKENIRDHAVEAYLDTFSEAIDSMDDPNKNVPARAQNSKFMSQVTPHALSMMVGNDWEAEVGGELGDIPFYGKQMFRGPGQYKLMKAIMVFMHANGMM